jgi:hypothetical protein
MAREPLDSYHRRSCPTNSPRWPHLQRWDYLRTTTAAFAQDRYRGIGLKFIKHGSRVLYRWSDVLEWLDRNTIQRIDDPRQQR